MTRTAKKAITPKQKKVTVLSVVGPARPTPFSARAAGAATSSIVSAVESAAAAREKREGDFTSENLAHGGAVSVNRQRGRTHRVNCQDIGSRT